jgi:hypothetical protein
MENGVVRQKLTLTLQKTSSGNAKECVKEGRAELFLDRSLVNPK